MRKEAKFSRSAWPNISRGLDGLRIPLLLAWSAGTVICAPPAVPASDSGFKPGLGTNGWASLFDGQTLNGWRVTPFISHGPVEIKGGQILLHAGSDLTGVSWTNTLPRTNYEISLEAMKVEGNDFFCGLTFPVGDASCTFIVGGWGGGIVGLSSIDGMDASENETSQSLSFETNRWYPIRVRVSPGRIQTWIDDKAMVDLPTAGRKISLRWGEIDLSQPLGVASWRTTAALRNVRLRPLGSEVKKVALIAGTKSHGPGEHEYEKGLDLLRSCLNQSSSAGQIKAGLYLNGWPEDPAVLSEADTIVLYCDGADRDEQAHPLLRDGRLDILERAMARGAGLVAIHYTVFVPRARGGKQFLDWLGGYFDYESGPATNHWYSRIETRDYAVEPATPEHPILRGVGPFTVREEFYFQLRLKSNDPAWAPILSFAPPAPEHVVAWACERPNGGRGFGYTGGHFHKNWDLPAVRTLLLNAIVWTAHGQVPEGGLRCAGP